MAYIFKIIFSGILVYLFMFVRVMGEESRFSDCSMKKMMWNSTKYEYVSHFSYSDTVVIGNSKLERDDYLEFGNAFFPFPYLCYYDDCVYKVIYEKKEIILITKKMCGKQTMYVYHHWEW